MPWKGASNEYPQHMFSGKNKKNINTFQLKKKTPYLELHEKDPLHYMQVMKNHASLHVYAVSSLFPAYRTSVYCRPLQDEMYSSSIVVQSAMTYFLLNIFVSILSFTEILYIALVLKGSIFLKNRQFLSKKSLINWYIILIISLNVASDSL